MSSAVLHITTQTNINRRKDKLTVSHPFRVGSRGVETRGRGNEERRASRPPGRHTDYQKPRWALKG